MIDFLGSELEVGDTVVLVAPGYRNLAKATVVRFTAQYVFLSYVNDWNYSSGHKEEIKQYPAQLVKIRREETE